MNSLPADSERPERRSIRLDGYDYSRAGAYFVTICTHERAPLFGAIEDGRVCLTESGRVVETTWSEIPGNHPGVEIDTFVVMPNHVHGILVMVDPVSGSGRDESRPYVAPAPSSKTEGSAVRALRGSGAIHRALPLGEIVRAFKARVTTAIRRQRGTTDDVWQRGYYEHVIRDEASLDRIRKYVVENPARWAFDRDNPTAASPERENAWLG